MSRIIIFAVLGIASTALAKEFNFTTCETLNVIKDVTHRLSAHEFTENLEHCSDAPNHNVTLNEGTIALLEVYKATQKNKDEECSFDDVMENKLIDCVSSKTGLKKDEFTAQAGKVHFALDTIEAVVFNPKTCQSSVELLHCIEEKLSEQKVSRELKGCKDKIIRGFDVTKVRCQNHLIHGDQNSGFYEIPSKVLIFASVAMLAELAMFF